MPNMHEIRMPRTVRRPDTGGPALRRGMYRCPHQQVQDQRIPECPATWCDAPWSSGRTLCPAVTQDARG
ncbi:hypothetical protein [Rhodovulum adriaticum]|uniref:Uncharacterized protein n=1 Tax=Rhodovulum adriaticum TaxID=35804 RepID=A0A4R2NMJ3_RHOAD|nr:hypothetical protein [Rhodovulum adriaticum]MBK1636348.1 hypothetical protein [Rhodovulum adriaticum]TCP22837.1 hypothetical protein EV656_105139 [Rhodovulum adriaticum]